MNIAKGLYFYAYYEPLLPRLNPEHGLTVRRTHSYRRSHRCFAKDMNFAKDF